LVDINRGTVQGFFELPSNSPAAGAAPVSTPPPASPQPGPIFVPGPM